MTLQKDSDRNEIRFLQKYVDLTNRRVLEIGCGEGRLTWQYASETSSTIAVDIDRDSLCVAWVDRPSDLEDKIHFSCSASEYLPFSKEKFDIAILAWSL